MNNESVQPQSENEWDDAAKSWDTDPYVRAYAAAAFESLTAITDASGMRLDTSQVIDFGCGTGLLTELLAEAGATVDAVDNSTAMLEVLEEKVEAGDLTGISLHQGLASANASVDLIVCSSVCGFLDDYPGTLAALTDRLRPGGMFIQWDWERGPDETEGLTRDDIRDALDHVGFVDVTVEDAFTVTVADATMSPVVGYGRKG